MKKRVFTRPPMGWNSYDNFDTNVNEEQVLANARVMKEKLAQYGWEYVVVDIQWYAANTGSQRPEVQYIPFGQSNLDEYSRFWPDETKFPSSAGGKGFKPLADQLHAMGLKFGIHIMRGIPRQAAHEHRKVLGTDLTADLIADPASICRWNPDMYGVKNTAAGQAYYDSILRLYADWGVDYIKCDDICNTNMWPDGWHGADEMVMLRKAADKVERDIVISLSPGPALVEHSWHYAVNANLWRITDDLWDDWKLVKDMFTRCEKWQDHVRMGNYPDCDMLPLGHIGEVFGNGRESNLTADEQKTLMTLWSLFRSPLMIGADLTRLDAQTLKLLTNRAVLDMNLEGQTPRQLERDDSHAVWLSEGEGQCFAALFNLSDDVQELTLPLDDVGSSFREAHELWNRRTSLIGDSLQTTVPPHGVAVFQLK